MKEINLILKIYFLGILLFLISCSNENDEYELYWYPTLRKDYILKVPTALPFTVDSIKYSDGKYSNGKKQVIYFILKDSVYTSNILIAGKNYSAGRIQDSIMRKDIDWSWVIKGNCVPDPNVDILLKQEIKILDKSDRYFRSYISYRDKKEKVLQATFRVRFDEIYFYIYIRIYEGDKSYIEILKDIDLIEKIDIVETN